MGNGSSNGEYGNIYVRTDKPYYFSGDVVTGTVYLNVIQGGFPGNILHLKVKGQEKCNWEEQRTVSEQKDGQVVNRTEIDYYHGKNSFYNHKIILYTFNGQYLIPGQYAFPFSFVLFGHLPGSFNEKGNGYSASIIYKIKGEVDTYQKNIKKMKHNQELIVREPLKSQMASLQGEMTVKAKVCCCVQKGESNIKCVFDKNHYLPNEQAFLWIDVDNSNCELDITEITGVLSQTLTLRSTQGRINTINHTMSSEVIQGIPARSKAVDDQRKTMSVQLIDKSGRYQDSSLKPTTTGQIVRCEYRLTATAVLSGCTCCATHPNVSVPINIVSPVPVTYTQVPQISNWNPQTFDVVQVSFTDKDLYQGTKSQYNYPAQNQNMNQMNQNNMMH